MRQLVFVTGILAIAVIVTLFARSRSRSFYGLPDFAADIVSVQRRPPRHVMINAVAGAVVAGLDGALYTIGGIWLIFAGVVLYKTTSGVGTPISLICLAIGLLCEGLAMFRIWQVWHALRFGDALVAEITQARVGRARSYGSMWGDLWSGTAATGSYQFPPTGDTGHYYMQQRWALSLKPQMQMWVVRLNGRDVLYAPKNPSAS